MRILLIATALVSVITAPWLIPSSSQQRVISSEQVIILINPGKTYQTMIGWEATDQAGQTEHRAKWMKYKDHLYDLAVNDLGINRVRLQVKATASGFDFTEFDRSLAELVVPLRQRLEARGEKLWVNVCVVEGALKDNPTLYAQNVLATYQRMRSKYGFVPDSWEAGLEPDHFGWGTQGSTMGYAIVAAGKLLAANGYPAKVFIAPSSSNTVHAIAYFDEMVRDVPDSTKYLAEFSYHLYGGADRRSREAMAMRALSRGLRVSQGEFIGATYEDLHQDLKVAQVSSWEQYTLCWVQSEWRGQGEKGDKGGNYYTADDESNPTNPPIVMASRTKFLRQYFKFIRRDAVRIGATSSYPAFDPVAFKNADGREVVVVKASSGGSFEIKGLSAGTYGIKYTTAKEYDMDAPEVTIGSKDFLSASIPDAGVITIYGTSSPSPTPKRTSNASLSFGWSFMNEIVADGAGAFFHG